MPDRKLDRKMDRKMDRKQRLVDGRAFNGRFKIEIKIKTTRQWPDDTEAGTFGRAR